jgi:hypothetical protein
MKKFPLKQQRIVLCFGYIVLLTSLYHMIEGILQDHFLFGFRIVLVLEFMEDIVVKYVLVVNIAMYKLCIFCMRRRMIMV